jgi:hypothetical protein
MVRVYHSLYKWVLVHHAISVHVSGECHQPTDMWPWFPSSWYSRKSAIRGQIASRLAICCPAHAFTHHAMLTTQGTDIRRQLPRASSEIRFPFETTSLAFASAISLPDQSTQPAAEQKTTDFHALQRCNTWLTNWSGEYACWFCKALSLPRR